MYGVTKFTTRSEAVQRLIVEPIEASECIDDAWGEFEIEAIADEVIASRRHTVPSHERKGELHYYQVVSVSDFWTIVAENEKAMV